MKQQFSLNGPKITIERRKMVNAHIEVKENVPLSRMTTFRMGGAAVRLWVPRRGDDLRELPLTGGCYLVISAGSNLLINDKRTFPDVISMREFDKSIVDLGQGRFKVGASARIQELIRVSKEAGYGGLEELVSIPGLVGGLICMNASVPSAGTCISDHIVEVAVFVDGKVVTMARDECGFGYRKSRFQDGKHIVLSATFDLPKRSREESERRIRARRERVRRMHDPSAPNFGSVYRVSNGKLMLVARRLRLGHGGVRFSGKTPNWLLNMGGSFDDAKRTMGRIERMHALLGRRCEREVTVWE